MTATEAEADDSRIRARDRSYRAQTIARTQRMVCQRCGVRPGQGEDGVNAWFGFVQPLDHLEYESVCWACFHALRRERKELWQSNK